MIEPLAQTYIGRGTARPYTCGVAMPATSRLRWYAARALTMTPADLAHRARTAARVMRDRTATTPDPPSVVVEAGWPRPPGAPPLVEDADVARVRAIPGVVAAAVAEAERIAEGRFAFFGYPEADLGETPDWHRDPVTGHRWPRLHWSRVDHRAAGADPKWLWELGRHQHVVHLARAWRLTGDDRYAAAAGRHLGSFLEQNPPGLGIHWRVGLELGMRLTSWAWAVEFLRGAPVATAELGGALEASVAAHLAQLERYPSLHSSANNHLIGELAGLVVGGLAFPRVPGASDRAERALADLGAELGRQVHADGIDAEQATAYGGFVLDLVLPVVASLTRLGRDVPEAVAGPVARMADALGVLASDGGTLPRIGDDDDAAGIDLGAHADRPARLHSRLRSAGLLLGRTPARVAPGLDEQTAWLCGTAAAHLPATERLPGSAVLPDGGYAVLRTRDGAGEVRAILKAGPFGLGPLYAHGHADLLSVYLSIDGEEVVVDAGTFTYYGDARWRDHGRSTAAHSTVRVDGRDQATPLGPFMWRNPPRAVLGAVRLGGDLQSAEGHHDAYAPVRHARRMELGGGRVTVIDHLSGPPGEHHLELRWQLAPGEVRAAGGDWVWGGGRAGLRVSVSGLGPVRAITGCDSRPDGFVSLALEHREPAATLLAEGRVALPATVVTTLTPIAGSAA